MKQLFLFKVLLKIREEYMDYPTQGIEPEISKEESASMLMVRKAASLNSKLCYSSILITTNLFILFYKWSLISIKTFFQIFKVVYSQQQLQYEQQDDTNQV